MIASCFKWFEWLLLVFCSLLALTSTIYYFVYIPNTPNPCTIPRMQAYFYTIPMLTPGTNISDLIKDLDLNSPSSAQINRDFMLFNSSRSAFGYKYRLLRYSEREITRAVRVLTPEHKRKVVLYIHGSGGDYAQVRSMAAAGSRNNGQGQSGDTRAQANSKYSSILEEDLIDFYAVDFNGEQSSLSADVISNQAIFVNDCLNTLRFMYSTDAFSIIHGNEHGLNLDNYALIEEIMKTNDEMKIVLVTHSYGSAVARYLPFVKNFNLVSAKNIQSIVMLAGPISAPAATHSPEINQIFNKMNDFYLRLKNIYIQEQSEIYDLNLSNPIAVSKIAPYLPQQDMDHNDIKNLAKIVYVSITAGSRDNQLPLHIANSNSMHLLSVTSNTEKLRSIGFISCDHVAIVWCEQIIKEVVFAIYNSMTPDLYLKANVNKQQVFRSIHVRTKRKSLQERFLVAEIEKIDVMLQNTLEFNETEIDGLNNKKRDLQRSLASAQDQFMIPESTDLVNDKTGFVEHERLHKKLCYDKEKYLFNDECEHRLLKLILEGDVDMYDTIVAYLTFKQQFGLTSVDDEDNFVVKMLKSMMLLWKDYVITSSAFISIISLNAIKAHLSSKPLTLPQLLNPIDQASNIIQSVLTPSVVGFATVGFLGFCLSLWFKLDATHEIYKRVLDSFQIEDKLILGQSELGLLQRIFLYFFHAGFLYIIIEVANLILLIIDSFFYLLPSSSTGFLKTFFFGGLCSFCGYVAYTTTHSILDEIRLGNLKPLPFGTQLEPVIVFLVALLLTLCGFLFFYPKYYFSNFNRFIGLFYIFGVFIAVQNLANFLSLWLYFSNVSLDEKLFPAEIGMKENGIGHLMKMTGHYQTIKEISARYQIQMKYQRPGLIENNSNPLVFIPMLAVLAVPIIHLLLIMRREWFQNDDLYGERIIRKVAHDIKHIKINQNLKEPLNFIIDAKVDDIYKAIEDHIDLKFNKTNDKKTHEVEFKVLEVELEKQLHVLAFLRRNNTIVNGIFDSVTVILFFFGPYNAWIIPYFVFLVAFIFLAAEYIYQDEILVKRTITKIEVQPKI